MIRILLVEDNSVDAFIAEKVIGLSGANAHLEIADGAAKALDLLTTRYLQTGELPNLILVDYYMPMQSGIQFLQAFAALDMPGKDKVITLMLTSSADPHVMLEAIRHGAHGLIPKPISINMVTDLITRVQPDHAVMIKNSTN